MYELIQAGENTFYINCPSKIGVYRSSPEEVWLIDSGNDKDAGRKIFKILGQQGWRLKGIINTHSNADHIGGNTLLQDRLNCPIYSTPMENVVIENPILEPSFLYGGYPFQKLRNKFLMATPSKAQNITQAQLPEGMEIFPLGGHFWQMIGVKTPDNVYFLADSVFSEAILDKYSISFNYDVTGYFKTLDFLETLDGVLYIPAHAEPTQDIHPLVAANRNKANEILNDLLAICLTPKFFEEILHSVFEKYNLIMDHAQYVLVGSTIRSYLSYLYDSGRIEAFVENNFLLWKAIDFSASVE